MAEGDIVEPEFTAPSGSDEELLRKARQARHRKARDKRADRQRSRKRRNLITGSMAVVLVLVVVAAVFIGSKLFSTENDFKGDGKRDVVIQVHDGDSTTAIGQILRDNNVVATVKAFVEAARNNQAIAAIQPGFYLVRTEIPAASAVQRLTDPANRVGKLVIPEGRQLDDVAVVGTDIVVDGIFTLIAKASCVDLDGQRKCAPVDQLRKAAQTAAAGSLNIPGWAAQPVAAMGTDHRRIEGLIAPGSFNIDPAASPQDMLAKLIGQSTDRYVAGGLLDTATAMNMSPYSVLVVASLVQRESKPVDFAKVARVIYNRMGQNSKLEFDSTVNYLLDRQEVATTDADRERVTPWNTYASAGLPATPICSPGEQALAAAEHPEAGDWLYFVTVDLQGTTLFTHEYQEHLANIELAKHNGVLDSAR
jgi:UPF0755 protein